MNGADPIWLDGSRVGVLLLHGFTASPYEMSLLGKYLHTHCGYTVSIPLIAGHGRGTHSLNSVSWEDWKESAIVAYEKLRLNSDSVCVIGMSMGGAIALNIAAHFPVDALVCMGTPMYLPKMAKFAKAIYRFKAAIEKRGGPDIADLEAKEHIVSLSTIPLHALTELEEMLEVFNNELTKVTCPTFLMHGKNDHTIDHKNMEMIASRISSELIRTRTLEKSFHILPLDLEREIVFSETKVFLKEILEDATHLQGNRL